MQGEMENGGLQPTYETEPVNNNGKSCEQSSSIVTKMEKTKKEKNKKNKHSSIAKGSLNGLKISKGAKVDSTGFGQPEDNVNHTRKIQASEQMDTESEISKNELNMKPKKFKAIKPTKKGANQVDKKKKTAAKTYSDLIATLGYLEKFDWLDTAHYNGKLLPSKNSFPFVICNKCSH